METGPVNTAVANAISAPERTEPDTFNTALAGYRTAVALLNSLAERDALNRAEVSAVRAAFAKKYGLPDNSIFL